MNTNSNTYNCTLSLHIYLHKIVVDIKAKNYYRIMQKKLNHFVMIL